MDGANERRIQLSRPLMESFGNEHGAGLQSELLRSTLGKSREDDPRRRGLPRRNQFGEFLRKSICLSGAGSGIDELYVSHYSSPPLMVMFSFP